MFSEKTVLVVDDEKDILRIIETVLHKEGIGYVVTAATATDGFAKFEQTNPDLVLLDIMLPDGEGYEVGQKIRNLSTIPILFVSAKSEEFDRILGFAMGGDDYITKPFSPKELAYRVKAQLRRADYSSVNEKQQPQVLKVGPFTLDEQQVILEKNDEMIDLRPKEFNLIKYFLQNKNKVISKESLYDTVWGEDYFGSDNTVMVHIRRIREKIEDDPSSPKFLVTVKGLGYKFTVEDE